MNDVTLTLAHDATLASVVDAITPKLVTDKVPQPNPQIVEPDPKDIFLVAVEDSLDAFVAAWVFRRVIQQANVPAEFVFVRGGVSTESPDDTAGRNFVSFGCPLTASKAKSTLVFERLANVPPSGVVIPFRRWKRTFPFGVESMTESLEIARISGPGSVALATWDFFYDGRAGFDRRPRLIDHLNDYVTQGGRYRDTAAVVACVESYPREFMVFDRLAEALDDSKRREFVVAGGQAILRYVEKQNPPA